MLDASRRNVRILGIARSLIARFRMEDRPLILPAMNLRVIQFVPQFLIGQRVLYAPAPGLIGKNQPCTHQQKEYQEGKQIGFDRMAILHIGKTDIQ